MSDIEKTTITIPKAAVIIVFCCGVVITNVTQYFTQKAATKDAISEIREEFRDKYKDLSFENRLQNTAIKGNTDANALTYNLLTNHLEKCENPNFKVYSK